MQLPDVRAFVTGGASGLGRAFVTGIVRGGGSAVIADRDADGVAAAVEALAGEPGRVAGVMGDVADEAAVERMLDEAAAAVGDLNVLVNNAGIFRDGLLVRKDDATGEIRTMSLQQWQQVIDVDLTGPFLCTRGFAARCVREGTRPAVIVNISSVARHGNRGQSNYSAAKAGLVADTKLWAEELARYGIRVGAIAPGFVRTPILQGMRPEVLEKMVRAIPLGRVAEPEELWQAVRFVIECEYFTGRCLDVDGGASV